MQRIGFVATLIALASATLGPDPALAGARLDIQGSTSLTYEVFDGEVARKSLRVGVRTDDAPPGAIRLQIAPRDHGEWRLDGPSGLLAFYVDEAGGNSAALRGQSFETVLTVSEQQDLFADLDVVVPDRQFASAGVYRGELEVNIFDAATGELLDGPKFVQVAVDVPARAQVNLAGTSAPFEAGANYKEINFGELESGESHTFYIQVRATSPATIRLVSENQGRLVHVRDNPMAPTSTLAYSISVDGEGATLAQPLELTRRPDPSLAGSAYPATITLGQVTNLLAGVHRDIITIDVFPQ